MSGSSNNINQQQHQQPMTLIKRPQHNNKLANALSNMLQCGNLVDVTIDCNGGQVNAHKLVLAASSTFFRNMFSKWTNAFHYPIIILREMPVNDLKTILQFIYHGEVNVPQDRVDSLMRCANYLQIDGMASSANSLSAILASSSSSSSMSHHNHLTGHGPISATSNTMNAYTTTMNKIPPQYPPTKQSRGHSSRSNNNMNNNNTSSSNNTSDNTSNKPKHTCPVCLKTFTHGFTLKRHQKLHSDNKSPITCDVCSKSYSCKDSFLRHKKSSGHLQHAEMFHPRSIDMNLGSNR